MFKLLAFTVLLYSQLTFAYPGQPKEISALLNIAETQSGLLDEISTDLNSLEKTKCFHPTCVFKPIEKKYLHIGNQEYLLTSLALNCNAVESDLKCDKAPDFMIFDSTEFKGVSLRMVAIDDVYYLSIVNLRKTYPVNVKSNY